MINREDIKEGLKFRMPNNKIERKHQGATDMCESIQYLTTLKTPHGDKNYVTLQVPLFEVCGGPKLISSADKNDPHRAWVGEYIKVRSDAIWKKPFYISLSDVMQRGRRAIDANLYPIFSTENPKNNWAYSNFLAAVAAAVKDTVWSITDVPLIRLTFFQSFPRLLNSQLEMPMRSATLPTVCTTPSKRRITTTAIVLRSCLRSAA